MIILQNYDDYESNPHSVLKIFSRDIKRFKSAWGLYAKGDRQRVDYKFLPDIMYELGSMFGIPKDLEKILKRLSIMNIHIENGGFVHYNDFLFSVMKYKYAEKLFRRADHNTSKLVAQENSNTLRKLKKIREKYYEKHKNYDDVHADKHDNFFLGMIYMKTTFKAWKNWAYKRRRGKYSENSLVSITPRPTEEDFPGMNSEEQGSIEELSVVKEEDYKFDYD
jgi:hypothetical protein